jgi:hypothetical protein
MLGSIRYARLVHPKAKLGAVQCDQCALDHKYFPGPPYQGHILPASAICCGFGLLGIIWWAGSCHPYSCLKSVGKIMAANVQAVVGSRTILNDQFVVDGISRKCSHTQEIVENFSFLDFF